MLGDGAQVGLGKAFLVLDGIDELPEEERKRLLSILKELISKEPFRNTVRVYVASQELLDISTAFSRSSLRTVVANKNERDIHKFLQTETDQLAKELDLDKDAPELREKIVSTIATGSEGISCPN